MNKDEMLAERFWYVDIRGHLDIAEVWEDANGGLNYQTTGMEEAEPLYHDTKGIEFIMGVPMPWVANPDQWANYLVNMDKEG